MIVSLEDSIKTIKRPFRWMALDVGQRRIGWAYSDPSWILGSPGGIIQVKNMKSIVTILINTINSYVIEGIVVGIPVKNNISFQSNNPIHSKQAKIIYTFADILNKNLQKQEYNVPITFFDESFSSKKADKVLLQELKVSMPYHKKKQDSLAASFILQDFLDYLMNLNRENS